jgi:DNA polymerase III subunit delta
MDTHTAYEQFIRDIKAKNYKPLYFLEGDEPYYIDQITQYIAENVLSEEERSFNQMVLYGKDTSIEQVIETARRFPMMAERQVVILKEAQELKDIDRLEKYLQAPQPSTLLVICYKYKNLDKRTRLYKQLKASAGVFSSKKLYDSQVPGWIERHFRAMNLKTEPGVSEMLTEYLGSDLGKIANEVRKLLINMEEGEDTVSRQHVESSIGISKDYNVFELQKAIGQRDSFKAQRIVQHFSYNPRAHPLVVTTGILYSYFSKLLKMHHLNGKDSRQIAAALGIHPFFAREYLEAKKNYSMKQVVGAISLLREYDMKSKGYGNITATDGDLLRELIFKIMH